MPWKQHLYPNQSILVAAKIGWLETPSTHWKFQNHEKRNLMRMKGNEEWEIPLDLIWSWLDLEWATWWLGEKLIVSWWAWLIVCTKIAPRFDDCWFREMVDECQPNLWMCLWWHKASMTTITSVKVRRICSNDKLVTKIGRDDKILNQHLNCWITVGWNLWCKEWLSQQTEGLSHVWLPPLTLLIPVRLGS